MASTYSDQHQFRPFYSLPPVTTPETHGSRPGSAQSPWSASSQISAEHLSLTLPSLSPGDLAQDPSLYEHLNSPQIYLAEPSAALPQPQPSHLPAPLSRTRRNTELYTVPEPESPDLFLNFEGSSQPQSPRSPITNSSSIVDLTNAHFADMAPASGKRNFSDKESQGVAKRRRLVTATGAPTGTEIDSSESGVGKVEELDMVEIDDDQQYEDFRTKQQADLIKKQNQEKADKPVKLTDFQCIICLDNPTDLTVTHCGHLFCSLCLHEALHAGTQRKTCPVCRQQINLAKNKEGKALKNGVFVLEMKLMTTRRKEKQPQDP